MSAKGYGLFFIGGAAYLFWLQRIAQPRFLLVNGVFAGWFLVVGLLLWFRFRWSPELYLASCILMIGEPVALIALDGYTTRRLVMILVGVIAAIAGSRACANESRRAVIHALQPCRRLNARS